MAAEVVVPIDRGTDREQSRAERRVGRRRIRFIKSIGEATTPRQKLDAALDYYRATIADHRVNPDKAAIATEHLADRLIASADQLGKTIRGRR
jgi:hypothetical protein